MTAVAERNKGSALAAVVGESAPASVIVQTQLFTCIPRKPRLFDAQDPSARYRDRDAIHPWKYFHGDAISRGL